MAKETNLAAVVEQVYKVMSPLDADQRARVIKSVSALFGDFVPDAGKQSQHGTGASEQRLSDQRWKPQVAGWMKRNGIEERHLEQIFHVEGEQVSIIADVVPGESKREQTVNCYVLEGVRAYIETGSSKFSDEAADELCKRLGCRDKTNHATNRSSAGNKLTGDKRTGFTLVAPGLNYGATLIKSMAPSEA